MTFQENHDIEQAIYYTVAFIGLIAGLGVFYFLGVALLSGNYATGVTAEVNQNVWALGIIGTGALLVGFVALLYARKCLSVHVQKSE
jgi:hypothetical protein